jgi:hypothetical protein
VAQETVTAVPQGRKHNGREIIVGYQLGGLCHACAIVARLQYAFDFDAGGKLLGTRLAAVNPIEK